MHRLILAIAVIALLSTPCAVALVAETGSAMVSDGIGMFVDSSTNGLSQNATETITKAATMYNPYDVPVVRKTIADTAWLAFIILFVYVLAGMGYIALQSHKPNIARTIDYNLNKGKSFNLNYYTKTIIIALSLFIAFGIIVTILLVFAQASTDIMDTGAIASIDASPNNLILKILYKCLWFIIWILMEIRKIILAIIAAPTLILITLFMFPQLERIVKIIWVYMAVMIFMQPIMVGTAAVGIGLISWLYLPTDNYAISVSSLALAIVLIIVALICVVGPVYFRDLWIHEV